MIDSSGLHEFTLQAPVQVRNTCSAHLRPEEHQLYSQPVGGQLQQVRVELLGVAKFLTLAVVRFHCSYLPIMCHHVVSDHNDDDDNDDDDDDEVTA